MDIILIPGLWLDSSSWAAVVPSLESAGHRVHPLTLPGMHTKADRSGISLADHVAAVLTAIDALDEADTVVLVGHSVGAAIAHAAIDARPDRVSRAIYIGGFPTADGDPLVDGLVADGPDVPLPPWSDFDDDEVRDLDDDARTELRRRAIPSPAGVVHGPQRLTDDRRYTVPVTLICPEFTPDQLRKWMQQGLAPVRELCRLADLELVDLNSGHWPQLTCPADLAQLIIAAITRDGPSRPRAQSHG